MLMIIYPLIVVIVTWFGSRFILKLLGRRVLLLLSCVFDACFLAFSLWWRPAADNFNMLYLYIVIISITRGLRIVFFTSKFVLKCFKAPLIIAMMIFLLQNLSLLEVIRRFHFPKLCFWWLQLHMESTLRRTVTLRSRIGPSGGILVLLFIYLLTTYSASTQNCTLW